MIKKLFIILILSFFISSIQAAIFNLTVTVGGETKSYGYSKVEDLIDSVKMSKIENNFPNYTGVEAVSVNVDFRGIPMTLSSSQSSESITLSIPALGTTKVFSGTTRDKSIDELENWLKKDGGDTLNALMKKLVELSPHDPLAGNPASLMSGMVASDFNRASQSNTPRPKAGGAAGATPNFFSMGVKFSSYSQNGLKGKTLTLPLAYTVNFDSNPGHQLIFELPLTYYVVEDAKSYNASFATAYKFPPLSGVKWYVTPSIGTGVVGSLDLGSVGQIISFSLTNTFERKEEYFRWGLGHLLGYYRTVKFGISDYKYNPDLVNIVMRLGGFISKAHPLFSLPVESEIFLFDTRFFGDKLYMNQYNEIGYSIGSDKDIPGVASLFRLGASYLFSSKNKGFTVNFGYSF